MEVHVQCAQPVRNKVTMDWSKVPMMVLQPDSIPPEYEAKGLSVNTAGRMSLSGPSKIDKVSLREYRSKHRLQELIFDLASGLTKHYVEWSVSPSTPCAAPVKTLPPKTTLRVRCHHVTPNRGGSGR